MLRRLTGAHTQLDKENYGFESRLSSHLHNTLNGIQHIGFGWNDSETTNYREKSQSVWSLNGMVCKIP